MTDLSYTNKDGLNLYEGFNNGFDYHRDGASSAQGYAHGGYPEITGETSDLPNTNYKTGDDPDFFNNGNVWQEVSPLVVESIAITKEPTKTEYNVGETLDLAGLEVTASYSGDGKKAVVTDYTTSPASGAALAETDTSVAVSYASQAASFAITVTNPTPVLTGIEITTPPTRLNYYNFTNVYPSIRNRYKEEFADEVLDLTGMVVSAVYSDGSKEVISDYTVSPAAGTLLLTDSFTVTYEDKEATQQLQTTMIDCISDVNWDGPDSPESSIEEYVFFDALELDAPTVVGLVNARQEGEAQSLCVTPLGNATVYTDNEGNTYNIPASGDSPTDADCRIIGPLAEPYDEKTIILIRIS